MFFNTRQFPRFEQLRAGLPFAKGVLVEAVNVSKVAGQVLATGMCTYIDLDTRLSLEDALNIIEIHQVAEYNKQVIELHGNQHH